MRSDWIIIPKKTCKAVIDGLILFGLLSGDSKQSRPGIEGTFCRLYTKRNSFRKKFFGKRFRALL